MVIEYTLLWFIMPFIGILNGIIRELSYAKIMGELLAHQISTVTGIIFFGTFTWLLSLKWPIPSARQAMTIGLIWLLLTISFEFLFGHYVMKHSWERLLFDYNILKGRLWIFVLITITIAPYVSFKVRT